MHTQQLPLEAEFSSPRGIANAMRFKQRSFLPQKKAEKKKDISCKKTMMVYKADTFLFNLLELRHTVKPHHIKEIGKNTQMSLKHRPTIFDNLVCHCQNR